MRYSNTSTAGRVLALLSDDSTMTSISIAENLGTTRKRVSNAVFVLVKDNLLKRRAVSASRNVSGEYQITAAGRLALGGYIAPVNKEAVAIIDNIVPPRQVNVLNTPELHPSRYLTNVPRREGSDSRVYLSKHV